MKLSNQNLRRRAQQAGLTLIELLVVLVILTGIGGLLIPTISSALSRTHVATCAQTFPEVHQMVQRALLEGGSLGTGFDSGIYTGGTDPVNNSTTTFTETGGGGNGLGALTTAALTADEAAGLADVGITNVFDHAATPPNVTFDIGGVSRTLAAGEAVITLTVAQADDIFLPTGNGEKYVWFGIGRTWTPLGTLAPEPPAHFGDTPGALPDEVHSRFGIVVEVFDEPDTSAVYKRVSYCLDGDGFETADGHVEVYWEELNES